MSTIADVVKLMTVGGTKSGRTVSQILVMRDELNCVKSDSCKMAKLAGVNEKTVERTLKSLVRNHELRAIEGGFIINPETITAKDQGASLKSWVEVL